ncbi:MAG: MBL fold metallo-hydrolase [Bdellovibrionota bacterium]|nr:MBL fold metallo-hydrolase [Bdellovibrionota bacterium]
MLKIETQYDADTFTLTYIVYDDNTGDAVIIDPVLDIDTAAGKLSFESLNKITSFVKTQKLNVKGILETHAHADHLSSSQYLKEQFPEAQVAISERIKIVQETFRPVFNLKDLNIDGSQFDLLFKDHETYNFGSVAVKILPTPGHTPACTSFLIEDNLFTGDALFMPDFGTGRCDFPAGSAEDLYKSISEEIYTLPDETKIWVGHDYQPNGRELKFQTTVKESKEDNIQLSSKTSKEQFFTFRTERDKTLAAPRLLLPSIQVNVDAGHLPKEEDNGMRYLKLPIK